MLDGGMLRGFGDVQVGEDESKAEHGASILSWLATLRQISNFAG